LTHLIRNSADHALKLRGAAAAGKPEEGVITLKAFHARKIVIEISDDGKGIDLEFVRRKAVERGMIGSRRR